MHPALGENGNWLRQWVAAFLAEPTRRIVRRSTLEADLRTRYRGSTLRAKSRSLVVGVTAGRTYHA